MLYITLPSKPTEWGRKPRKQSNSHLEIFFSCLCLGFGLKVGNKSLLGPLERIGQNSWEHRYTVRKAMTNLPLSLQVLSAQEGSCSDAAPSPARCSSGVLSSNRAKHVGLLLCSAHTVKDLLCLTSRRQHCGLWQGHASTEIPNPCVGKEISNKQKHQDQTKHPKMN